MDPEERQRQIRKHLESARRLQEEEAAAAEGAVTPWESTGGFYLIWHLVFGAMLGVLGAMVSLAANFLGAPLFGKHPMELIRVYLTFPMGERALSEEWGPLLGVGSILYVFTGVIYGIIFHLLARVYLRDVSPGRRFLLGSLFGLGLWVINFYLILSWLQPLLQDGNWIVRLIPPWVGAATHLTFAWTMLVGENFSRFENKGRMAP